MSMADFPYLELPPHAPSDEAAHYSRGAGADQMATGGNQNSPAECHSAGARSPRRSCSAGGGSGLQFHRALPWNGLFRPFWPTRRLKSGNRLARCNVLSREHLFVRTLQEDVHHPEHGQAKYDDTDHHDEIFNFCCALVGNQ
jgi:hypothetical protein